MATFQHGTMAGSSIDATGTAAAAHARTRTPPARLAHTSLLAPFLQLLRVVASGEWDSVRSASMEEIWRRHLDAEELRRVSALQPLPFGRDWETWLQLMAHYSLLLACCA